MLLRVATLWNIGSIIIEAVLNPNQYPVVILTEHGCKTEEIEMLQLENYSLVANSYRLVLKVEGLVFIAKTICIKIIQNVLSG